MSTSGLPVAITPARMPWLLLTTESEMDMPPPGEPLKNTPAPVSESWPPRLVSTIRLLEITESSTTNSAPGAPVPSVARAVIRSWSTIWTSRIVALPSIAVIMMPAAKPP